MVSTPKIPEWEQISLKLQGTVEAMILGGAAPDSALAKLDREVDRILEKRRWLLEHGRGPGARALDDTPAGGVGPDAEAVR